MKCMRDISTKELGYSKTVKLTDTGNYKNFLVRKGIYKIDRFKERSKIYFNDWHMEEWIGGYKVK